MSHILALVGESGSGKSTSLRNLDPKSTYIISVINKPLPFKNGKKFSKEDKNYSSTTSFEKIKALMQSISSKADHIKVIVVDDFQYTMTNDFVLRAKEKGYDKWSEMAQNVYNTIEFSKTLRDDLIIIYVFHEEIDGEKRKIKTLGKMLNEKVTVEGLFTTVIFSEAKENGFVFPTQSKGQTTAKSPMEMLEDEMENDILIVIDAIRKY